MSLVCYMIYEDHVTKRPSKFICWTHLRKVTILPGLVAIGTVVLEIQ